MKRRLSSVFALIFTLTVLTYDIAAAEKPKPSVKASPNPQTEQSAPSIDKPLTVPANILPIVKSVTPVKDYQGAQVMIEGDNFVSLYDKGYNKVHFGTVSAAFVAVSKNKLWATVPDMSPGNVKISVTTQNGTSNAVDFTVEKPSWKFW